MALEPGNLSDIKTLALEEWEHVMGHPLYRHARRRKLAGTSLRNFWGLP
jgi:hypothetical protein